MSDIIEHQLKRAASGGALLGQAPLDVEPLVERAARDAAEGVCAQGSVDRASSVEPGAQFVGDRGDLSSCSAICIDNACKWCTEQVRVSVSLIATAVPRQRLRSWSRTTARASPKRTRTRVLERGVRTDESVPGHGLGLAMVRDTVDLYGGDSSTIERSELRWQRGSALRHLPGRSIVVCSIRALCDPQ